MLMQILLAWATAALGLWLAAQMLSGVRLGSFADAIWAGALLGFLEWVLYYPLFFVMGVGTLGIAWILFFITRWIISALVILLTAKLSSRLEVRGFFNALLTAFIIAATGSVVDLLRH
ncbi:MAG TPA: phage holin family protein [Polyangiales bacterium]